MLARPGTLEPLLVSRLSIRPAITKLWPSLISNSVSARRVLSEGITKPEMVSPFAKSRVLTSGFTCKWILPFGMMTGVKRRRTPNSLNWIVTEFNPAVPCTTGNGNSPPARKLASWPFIAIRLGSARICSTFFCCKAFTTAPRLMSVRKRKTFNRSVMPNDAGW